MGVYIPKKTMPQNCSFCPCARMNVSRNGIECSAVNFYAENLMPQKGRMECCPLVEVKPHGRLIDADALIKKMITEGWADGCGWADALDLALAPTIIEAEAEEK